MVQLKCRTSFKPKCFEETLEVASENWESVVVHAWIQGDNQWILHAWCEIEEEVIDLTETRSPIPKADYYEIMGVTEKRLRRYSRLEFFTLVADEGHFGPFDKAFFIGQTTAKDPVTFRV